MEAAFFLFSFLLPSFISSSHFREKITAVLSSQFFTVYWCDTKIYIMSKRFTLDDIVACILFFFCCSFHHKDLCEIKKMFVFYHFSRRERWETWICQIHSNVTLCVESWEKWERKIGKEKKSNKASHSCEDRENCETIA